MGQSHQMSYVEHIPTSLCLATGKHNKCALAYVQPNVIQFTCVVGSVGANGIWKIISNDWGIFQSFLSHGLLRTFHMYNKQEQLKYFLLQLGWVISGE